MQGKVLVILVIMKTGKGAIFSILNPNQGGLFGRSVGWGGGGIKTSLFLGLYSPVFDPNHSEVIQNETWHLYKPIETLSNIL